MAESTAEEGSTAAHPVPSTSPGWGAAGHPKGQSPGAAQVWQGEGDDLGDAALPHACLSFPSTRHICIAPGIPGGVTAATPLPSLLHAPPPRKQEEGAAGTLRASPLPQCSVPTAR